MSALPITPLRDKLVSGLQRGGALVLAAPTGSGKSTQTPQFLLGAVKGRILVLEPRRVSARGLAARVACETRTPLGAMVGYQVRFDSRCGPAARIVFQTYGVFVSHMMRDPELKGVDAVLLDEFHERTLECDLALAWLKALRRKRPELKLVVMSATLEGACLARYLPGAASLEVPGRLFPVVISHHPLTARESAAEGALAALRGLAREGLDGSVLVFMPGLAEIRRAVTALTPYCREQDLDLRTLHGGMELDDQQAVLDPGERPRVIVTTNVAETGLTVPGVTAVIDSGQHRVAAFDAGRGINTLHLSRISRGNADQRAGRAGRTAPGRCVRLWSKADEAAMAPSMRPEMARLELSALRLQAASLPEPVDWLTPPPETAWEAARDALEALGAEEEGHVTQRGRALLRYPASPRVAAVLEDARALGPQAYERACAMAGVFETAAGGAPGLSTDLAERAADLLSGAKGEGLSQAREVFRQLRRMGGDSPARSAGPDALARLWLAAFTDRLAAREGEGAFYRLQDGRGALLGGAKAPPPLLLALDARERAGGGKARQVTVSLYLPFTPEAAAAAFPGECAWKEAGEFDERKGRVVKEERLLFRGLVLDRREHAVRKEDRKAVAELWAEKFATGELRHPGLDEKVPRYLVRVALARRLYPGMGFPELGPDDWRLIYGEVCAGKNTLKDIERVPLLPRIEDYLGKPLSSFLDRVLPETKKLPSGRLGRFSYHETRPAELSARLGDFLKMNGTLALCEGRLPVVFDILAPNHRTVQKTSDLSSFWKNTYPAVKKELQRRYPKHPWP